MNVGNIIHVAGVALLRFTVLGFGTNQPFLRPLFSIQTHQT